MVPWIRWVFVFAIATLSASASGDSPASEQDALVTLPNKCVHAANESLVSCVEVGLKEFPLGLPISKHLTVKKNDFPVLETVPYPGLVTLHLEHNNIQVISGGAFGQLSDLETLGLSGNRIIGLRKETFDGLKKLKTLDLENNTLYYIAEDTFSGMKMPFLEVLDLSLAGIYYMDDASIHGLGNLHLLNISGNFLTRLPVIGCENHTVHKLKILDLAWNRIDSLDGFQCAHMTALEEVDLSHNNLQTLAENALHGATDLKTFSVSGNQISFIHKAAFHKTPKIQTIDVSNNNISRLDRKAFMWTYVHKVLVDGNPWACNCENEWLFEKAVTDCNDKDQVR